MVVSMSSQSDRRMAVTLAFVLALGGAACEAGDPSAEARPGTAPRSAAIRANRPRVVVLGDSLTAGLGLPIDESFPSVLQRRIDDAGFDFEIVNAGSSGDTSAGGLRRLDWSLGGDVRILILALGANDGLRGLSIEQMRENLSSIIEQAQARGILVLLAGMEALPNFGPEYTATFRGVYPELAARYDIALVPFLLAGVAGDPALNQADGVHPNAEGARRVAAVVWPELEPLIEAASTE
jgi:acyl-CoA thioesterase-1